MMTRAGCWIPPLLSLVLVGCAARQKTAPTARPAVPPPAPCPAVDGQGRGWAIQRVKPDRLPGVTLFHVAEPKHTAEQNLRMGRAIAEVRPDAILFEYPTINGRTLSEFNAHAPRAKPEARVRNWIEFYKKVALRYPWFGTWYVMFEPIRNQWRQGRQVLLFEIDAPQELTAIGPTRGTQNAAWTYLRERYMAAHIREVAARLKGGRLLVSCHDFHWKRVLFLLEDHDQEATLQFFFGQTFIGTVSGLENLIRNGHPMIHRHWLKISGLRSQ
jgi:hypothetical protein